MSANREVASFGMIRCLACGNVESPTRSVCSRCLSDRFDPVSVPGVGTLVSWTTIRRAPSRFRDDAPYDVVVVDLDGGQRVTGRLGVQSPAPSIGARVEAIRIEGADALFTVEPA